LFKLVGKSFKFIFYRILFFYTGLKLLTRKLISQTRERLDSIPLVLEGDEFIEVRGLLGLLGIIPAIAQVFLAVLCA